MTDVTQFYDDLAADYHYIFPNWQQSMERQAGILDSFLRKLDVLPPATIWDCTCGIGTQAIGLATKGYSVHATDLSPGAIEQAQANVASFATLVAPTFGVVDLLHPPEITNTFDVVLAFDNAISHFMTDADLETALRTMIAGVKPGGRLLVSLRDYDTIILDKPHTTLPTVREDEQGKHIVFQVWDWAEDGLSYDFQMFVVHEEGGEWRTRCLSSRFRALLRRELQAAMEAVGLVDIQVHMPETSGYYQPSGMGLH